MEELIGRLRACPDRRRPSTSIVTATGAAARRERLRAYLESRATRRSCSSARPPGYRGARVSGIPFTSERQLTGAGPAEATATIVRRVLAELGLADERSAGTSSRRIRTGGSDSNRRPTRAEIDARVAFLRALARGRRVVPVGRLAEAALGVPASATRATAARGAFRGACERLLA